LRSIFLSIWLLTNLFLSGNTQARQVDFTSTYYTIQKEIPLAEVRAVIQNRQGFLWFGSENGLYRYDGYNLTSFNTVEDDSTSISGNNITALIEDSDGYLWIGTSSGLNRMDPTTERFTRVNFIPDRPKNSSEIVITSIFEDRAGTLWVGTMRDGLIRMNRTSITVQHTYRADDTTDSISSNTVLSVSQDLTGLLWIGTRIGLNRFDPTTARYISYRYQTDEPGSLSSNAVLTTTEDRSGRIWVGTLSGGLNRYERIRDRFIHYPLQGDGSRAAISIYEDDAGFLWIGTRKGLLFFDTNTERYVLPSLLGQSETIRDRRVYDIFEDRSGVIWIGTSHGIFKILRTPFVHIQRDPSSSNGLRNNNVLSLLENLSENIWIGTINGLDRLNRQTGEYKHIELISYLDNTPREPAVHSLMEDRRGNIWAGSDYGFYIYNPTTEQSGHHLPRPQSTDRRSNLILSLLETRDGEILIGTGRGLYTFDRRSTTLSRKSFGIGRLEDQTGNTVITVYEDQKNILWIGTGSGLFSYDPSTGTTSSYYQNPSDPHTISDNRILTIFEDHAGTMWIGTRNGLNRFDAVSDSFDRYTMQHGLPHEAIAGILQETDGRLWLSTGNGLSRFDPESESSDNFGIIDGLQGEVFSRGACVATTGGTMIFGGSNGINLFDPIRIKENTSIPPVVLTSFSVRGGAYTPDQSLSTVSTIDLDYRQNFFSFEFAVLDYLDPENNQYVYKLDGLDQDWIESGSRRFVSYTNVPPGDYVFRVKGAGSNGLWNEQGLEVLVSIAPPFWMARWFYVLCLLTGFVLLTYVRAILHSRRLQIQSRELEQKVEERTQDLEAEKRTTEEQAERLIQIERLKSRFFANISHEFRTPLTLILGPLNDVISGSLGPVSERIRGQLRLMRKNSVLLQKLINQLLDLSKLEVNEVRLRAVPGDLIPFVNDIALSFSPVAEREKITLQCHVEDQHKQSLSVFFDPDKLEKVIRNLVSNAIKFTSPSGKISVLVREQHVEGEGYAVIEVRDTGEGIPDNELPYIFDRFYQSDSSMISRHHGTGIGLSLAKELVELHGGTLSVESERGFGSTFTVQLPLGSGHLREDQIESGLEEVEKEGAAVDEFGSMEVEEYGGAGDLEFWSDSDDGDNASPDQVDSPSLKHSDTAGATILIADDNADMLAYLKRHLQPFYRVAEAMDGKEALALAHSLQPDLVISDVMMPEMDGYSLCMALKKDEKLAHIPVILLTAKADETEEIEGLAALADDYIHKPFSMDTLRSRVENLIEIRRLLRRRYGRVWEVQPEDVSVDSVDSAFIQRVRSVVESHMGDTQFNVEQLADSVGFSTRQLQRKLRSLTRLSAAGFIRLMRLQRAAQLLEQQAGNVSEIAYRVGFRDASHFSRLFRQTFGIVPSEYRANGTFDGDK